MLFTQPVDFEEALASRAVRVAMPTTLKSRELERLSGPTRERARFAAQVARVDFLNKADEILGAIIQPKQIERPLDDGTFARVTQGMDFATGRLELKKFLRSVRYQAPDGKAGTIEDLGSDRRLNLILGVNTQQMQGAGYWEQGQNEGVLSEWPAMELYRAEERKEKRDWIVIWLNAAGEVGDEAAARAVRVHGRMVARKDSAIWTHLGPFQLPYSPFDWGSGMDTRDVQRDDAIALGVFKDGDVVKIQKRGLNDLLQASPNVRSAGLRKAVLEELGDGYEFDGDVLKRKNEALPTMGTPSPRPSPSGRGRSVSPAPGSSTRPGPQPGRGESAEGPRTTSPATAVALGQPRRPENPVSAGLQVVRREPGRLEELKTIIDRIHDDGRLPRIPVDGNPPKGANGAYGFYPGDGRPARIAVRTYDGDAVTFAHEIGHFIDHQAMGTRGEYASKGSKEMASWRKAVRATALAQKLAEQKKNALFGKKRINYLLSPHELWARSYAQWIVLKARQGEFGSADLRAKMEAELKARLAGPFQGGHWSDEDFKPVAEAIDELMRKKGWLL